MSPRWYAMTVLVVSLSAIALVSQASGSPSVANKSKLQIAQNLPLAALSIQDQSSLLGSIPENAKTRFGIDSSSVSSARLLSNSGSMKFLAIIGSKGICVVSKSAFGAGSCSATASANTPLTLFTPDPSSGFLVGTGIGSGDTTLATDDGDISLAATANGEYQLSPSDQVAPEVSGQTSTTDTAATSANASSTMAAAAQTQQCRRFAPSLLPDGDNCFTRATMVAGSFYTASNMYRVEAEIALNSDRGAKVWYVGTNISSQGSGDYFYITSSGSQSVKAGCQFSGSNVTGQCSSIFWTS